MEGEYLLDLESDFQKIAVVACTCVSASVRGLVYIPSGEINNCGCTPTMNIITQATAVYIDRMAAENYNADLTSMAIGNKITIIYVVCV